MFITDEEAAARVSSLDNLINRLELRKIHNGGRPKGRKNDSLQKRLEVATTAIEKGPTAAAEIYGTTISRASLLSSGIVTHSNGSDEKLAPAVTDKKQQIHEKALDIVAHTLFSIEKKLDEVTKPSELASLASEMAKIAERTGGRLNPNAADSPPKVNVVIFAPRMKDESEYEIIEVVDKQD